MFGSSTLGPLNDHKAAVLQADSFDVNKHLVKNMVVLMRSEEEDDVEWTKCWSIARVNRCATQ